MPFYKRFYPSPSATKAIKRDAEKANDILGILERDAYFSNDGPDWLRELEDQETASDKEKSRLEKNLEKLKVLVIKLRLAGVGFEETDELSSINQALKQAYPP